MGEPLSASIGEHLEESDGLPASEAIAEAIAEMKDRPLPGFEPPPYDSEGWNRRLASKQRMVKAAKSAWKSAQEHANTLKKTWERETDEQDELYLAMDEEKRYAQGTLVVGQAPLGVGSSSCRYEQETGEPCPGCILLRKHGCPLPDPEDTEHATVVREALELADDRDGLLTVLNTGREVGFARELVEAWSVDEARHVSLWLALNANLPTDANQVPPPVAVFNLDAQVGDGTPITVGEQPATAAEALEQAADAAKVCLCQEPDFVVPVGKDSSDDARCTKCDGAPTGDKVNSIRFAQEPKGKKARSKKATH